MPLTHDVDIVESARHAHHAQYIEWCEGKNETENPCPESPRADAFIERKSGDFWEPVGECREKAKKNAADDDIVKVCDEKEAIVQLEVDAGNREHHTRHAADREGHDESHKPQHRGRE